MAILFITTGLIGSGKSMVAESISKKFNTELLSTDIARKEIFKIIKIHRKLLPASLDAGLTEFSFDSGFLGCQKSFIQHLKMLVFAFLSTRKNKKKGYGKGIYAKEKKEMIYDKLFEIAEEKLKKGNNVIIDATFQKQEQRDKAKQIAEKTNSKFIIIYCNPPEEKIKEWLVKRKKEKTFSDATINILRDFKKEFDKVELNEDIIIVNTSKKDFLEKTEEKIKERLKSPP